MRCRPLGQGGESLIEVMATVTILGMITGPFILFAASAIQSLALERATEQALVYAKEGVASVRQDAITAAAHGQAPPVVAPPVLASVGGTAYTESIVGPASPLWQSPAVPFQEWTVTVSFAAPPGGGTHAVSLQVVVDPAADPPAP